MSHITFYVSEKLEKTTLTKYRHTGIQNSNGKVITKNESVEQKMLLNEIPGSYLTEENCRVGNVKSVKLN